MTTLDTLTCLVATTLGIDDDAAHDLLETHITDTERATGDTIDPDEISDDDAVFLLEACRQSQKSGDLGQNQLARLEGICREYDQAYATFQTVEQQRMQAIKDAFSNGARVAEVRGITGLSRTRIYNIKNEM